MGVQATVTIGQVPHRVERKGGKSSGVHRKDEEGGVASQARKKEGRGENSSERHSYKGETRHCLILATGGGES